MKTIKNISLHIFSLLLFAVPALLFAQDAETPAKPVNKAVRKTFENPILINNQTVEGLNKKALDFNIEHRFGTIVDENDMFGLFAPANIRLALTYGVTDNLSVGIGAMKLKHTYDLNWKY